MIFVKIIFYLYMELWCFFYIYIYWLYYKSKMLKIKNIYKILIKKKGINVILLFV